MSKLLDKYHYLKEQNPNIIYLFKTGVFYLALENDAKYLAKEFNLKLVKFNEKTVKCGFPCSSFDKYYILLKNLDKEFKIVDTSVLSDAKTYLENKEIFNLLLKIEKIDVNNLSVSQAYILIDEIQRQAKQVLGGLNECSK